MLDKRTREYKAIKELAYRKYLILMSISKYFDYYITQGLLLEKFIPLIEYPDIFRNEYSLTYKGMWICYLCKENLL